MHAPGEPSDPEPSNQTASAPGRSRVCVHCGKVVAADRKRLCDHCGEPFADPGDPGSRELRPTAVELTITSRRGLVGGLVIALAIPVGLWVLAQLVEHGLAPYDQLHALLNPLVDLALLEVALGPIGLALFLTRRHRAGPTRCAAPTARRSQR